MTNEEANIATAEACGYTILDKPDLSGGAACYALNKQGIPVCGIPDYGNDLNAMREAVMTLPSDLRELYGRNLYVAVDASMDRHPELDEALGLMAHPEVLYYTSTADPSIVQEAFLRTKGKWRE